MGGDENILRRTRLALVMDEAGQVEDFSPTASSRVPGSRECVSFSAYEFRGGQSRGTVVAGRRTGPLCQKWETDQVMVRLPVQ